METRDARGRLACLRGALDQCGAVSAGQHSVVSDGVQLGPRAVRNKLVAGLRRVARPQLHLGNQTDHLLSPIPETNRQVILSIDTHVHTHTAWTPHAHRCRPHVLNWVKIDFTPQSTASESTVHSVPWKKTDFTLQSRISGLILKSILTEESAFRQGERSAFKQAERSVARQSKKSVFKPGKEVCLEAEPRL